MSIKGTGEHLTVVSEDPVTYHRHLGGVRYPLCSDTRHKGSTPASAPPLSLSATSFSGNKKKKTGDPCCWQYRTQCHPISPVPPPTAWHMRMTQQMVARV